MRARPGRCLQRLVRHQRINEGAVESFGDAPQRRQFYGALGFGLFQRNDRRLFDAEPFRELLGGHAEDLPEWPWIHPRTGTVNRDDGAIWLKRLSSWEREWAASLALVIGYNLFLTIHYRL